MQFLGNGAFESSNHLILHLRPLSNMKYYYVNFLPIEKKGSILKQSFFDERL